MIGSLNQSARSLSAAFAGCLKGEDSLVEAREREHRIEKDRSAR